MDGFAELKEAEQENKFVPMKYGSQTDRRGREYVGVMPVLSWETHKEEAAFLWEQFESLYTSFVALHQSSKPGQ